ncbi:unnamed protein product [Euphydryas editha]|uniref:Uncharacterized protein n=1 Tax=Euphydryas editha TaxID=104508 RepID=A0AAU9TNT6_EUPED|nr:unnamed protein product [Euphydryas editha]
MFYILATKLSQKIPTLQNFSKTGYGKSAPFGVLAAVGDIDNLDSFVEAIQQKCLGIIIAVIDDKSIEDMTTTIQEETA